MYCSRISKTLPARVLRRAFTLVELLIVVAILVLITGISTPYLARMYQSNVLYSNLAKTEAALQYIFSVASIYRSGDRSESVPVVANADYSGIMVLYDGDEWIYANNVQEAQDASGNYLESMLPYKNEGYRRLRSEEPMGISDSIIILGVRLVEGNKTEIELVEPPFALAARSDSYGLPPAPLLCYDFQDSVTGKVDGVFDISHYKDGGEAVYGCLPAVIVCHKQILRDSGIYLDIQNKGRVIDSAETSRGATIAKADLVHELLYTGKAELVQMSIQSGTLLDCTK